MTKQSEAEKDPPKVDPNTATIGQALAGDLDPMPDENSTPRGILLRSLQGKVVNRDRSKHAAAEARDMAEQADARADGLDTQIGDLLAAVRDLDKGTEYEDK